MAKLKRAVEAKRTLLREKLPVAQRKLVLRIVDDLNAMMLDLSLDSLQRLFNIKITRHKTNGGNPSSYIPNGFPPLLLQK